MTELSAELCEGESIIFNGEEIMDAGVYEANLQTVNGCDSTVTTNISILTSTFENLAEELNLSIFPNPNNGRFFVQFNLPKAMDIKLNIFDVVGRKNIYSQNKKWLDQGEHTFELNGRDWPSGVYLLRIKTDEGIGCSKIFIE